MEEKEILAKANELLEDKITALSINNVNHVLGHPYTIGPKHVVYASDNCGGMLGEAAIERFEKQQRIGMCAHPGCNAYYHEHKSDRVLFLQLKDNLSQDEGSALLKKISDLLKENTIDGIAFVETKEKFRIS